MQQSFYKTYFEMEKYHWLLRGKRLIVIDTLNRFIKKRPPEKVRILDYGCASGLYASTLAKQGYFVDGLDMSTEAVEFGRQQGVKNLRVIDPNSTKIDFPDNTFDAVLILDVLEHIKDETVIVREIYRVLKPGGIVISTVPAYMWMWTHHDVTAHHYRRYTRHNFLKMTKQTVPWNVLYAGHFDTILFLPIALVRIVSNVFHLDKRESDFDINTPLMNKVCFAIMKVEQWLLKFMTFPFGVSIITVFEKPIVKK